jgi:hypothetical protein
MFGTAVLGFFFVMGNSAERSTNIWLRFNSRLLAPFCRVSNFTTCLDMSFSGAILTVDGLAVVEFIFRA